MVTCIALQSVTHVAWKNGGGLTRELLSWPVADAWQVRCSVATIDRQGRFSRFAGVERWFTVISPIGLSLTMNGQVFKLDGDSAPLQFDGAHDCVVTEIEGNVTAFNVMATNGWQASVARSKGGDQANLQPLDFLGLFCLQKGVCQIGDRIVHACVNQFYWRQVFDACRVDVLSGQWLLVRGFQVSAVVSN